MKKSLEAAANRLHHLSMRYVGAFMEMVTGKKIGTIKSGTPGIKEMRDLIDLILLTRAEISGLTKILSQKLGVRLEHFQRVMEEEYDWLTINKASQLGIGVNDDGLVFSADLIVEPIGLGDLSNWDKNVPLVVIMDEDKPYRVIIDGRPFVGYKAEILAHLVDNGFMVKREERT